MLMRQSYFSVQSIKYRGLGHILPGPVGFWTKVRKLDLRIQNGRPHRSLFTSSRRKASLFDWPGPLGPGLFSPLRLVPELTLQFRSDKAGKLVHIYKYSRLCDRIRVITDLNRLCVGRISKNPHSGRESRIHAMQAVFDDDAVRRRIIHIVCRMKKKIRIWLGATGRAGGIEPSFEKRN